VTSRDDGVFVARAGEENWEYDAETGGLVHLVRFDDRIQAGLWRPGEAAGKQIEVELMADETFLVLAGSGTLRIDGREELELRPGDMISLDKGAKTVWVVDEDFKEFWVYSGF
jgi:uncharacterized cupin superfamily protein